MRNEPLLRTVALEEHFNIPSLVARIPEEVIRERGFPPPDKQPAATLRVHDKLSDLGAGRIADMDSGGLTMAVLSVSGPGADLLPPAEAVPWAIEANDILAASIAKYPARLAGFAHLPTTDPERSATELERCVTRLGFVGTLINGLTDGQFLDHPSYDPILTAAEQLDVPIYIHPNIPPEPVRKAYYSGLPDPFGFQLSIAGFGWHAETAIHVLRLIFSGTLDRHPKLKIIIGHMGEFLPMTLARTDALSLPETAKQLKRSVAQTLRDQVYVTTSGQFTNPPMTALLSTFGIDNVMYSVDYPYSPNDRGKAFLDQLPLAPTDVQKLPT